MKYIIITLLVLTSICQVNAQNEPFEKVINQKTIEVGYRYLFQNTFTNQANMGYTVMFDYAWKLSGYNKKKAVYLTIPLGYTMLMANNREIDKDVAVVSYGWTVRHELARDKKTIPFLGYGLLLNQLRIMGVDGSVMGHQTRFEFGFNFRCQSKIKTFIKAEYTYSSYGALGNKKRSMMQFAEIKTGIRF